MNIEIVKYLVDNSIPFLVLTDGTIVVNYKDGIGGTIPIGGGDQSIMSSKGIGGTIPIGGNRILAAQEDGIGGTIPIGGGNVRVIIEIITEE